MKTSALLVCVFLVVNASYANDEKYITAMKQSIDSIQSAQTPDQIQRAVNGFARIAAVEKTKWEPQYYIGYSYIIMATSEKDAAKKDAYLDKAMEAIAIASKIAPEESEVAAIEGFAYMIRLTVDPPTRGQKYSALAYQSFGKAVSLNPENPRALGLLAQMQFGTAKFFGSPTTEACATMEKALEKFDTFTSTDPIKPTWGRKMTESLKPNCGSK